jgi:hypothetical protein
MGGHGPFRGLDAPLAHFPYSTITSIENLRPHRDPTVRLRGVAYNRKWIPVVIFWTFLLTSIGFGKRHSLVNSFWVAVECLFLVILSGYAVLQAFLHRHEQGYFSYRRVPRWLDRFSRDE